MKMNFDVAQIEMPRAQMLKLFDARGSQVSCASGVLWITQDGERDDVVLGAGQSLRIQRDGLTLIYACKDAALRIDAAKAGRAGLSKNARSATPVLHSRKGAGALTFSICCTA
ncbi:MAG: DUF2917 domain-containing protein [Burkholderiaceae bacterium]|nr:DUF2917 domain-containing protein [Burkholderiaceae bacterium]